MKHDELIFYSASGWLGHIHFHYMKEARSNSRIQ